MAKNYDLIRIREEELGLTQSEFAKKIPMDKTSYAYKENGKRKIWVDEANKIIKTINNISKEKGLEKNYNYNDIFLN